MVRAWQALRSGFEAPALVAMGVYGVLSFLLSPEFPFATVDMYANVGHRYGGARPVVLVDDREVDVHTLTDFRGVDPTALVMGPHPCSEAYRIDAIRNHVAGHLATADAPEGALRVVFAWRLYHMEPDGRVVDDGTDTMATATARSAP